MAAGNIVTFSPSLAAGPLAEAAAAKHRAFALAELARGAVMEMPSDELPEGSAAGFIVATVETLRSAPVLVAWRLIASNPAGLWPLEMAVPVQLALERGWVSTPQELALEGYNTPIGLRRLCLPPPTRR